MPDLALRLHFDWRGPEPDQPAAAVLTNFGIAARTVAVSAALFPIADLTAAPAAVLAATAALVLPSFAISNCRSLFYSRCSVFWLACANLSFVFERMHQLTNV